MPRLRGCVWVLPSGSRCARSDTAQADFWSVDQQGERQEHQTRFCDQHYDAGVEGLLSVVLGLNYYPGTRDRWLALLSEL